MENHPHMYQSFKLQIYDSHHSNLVSSIDCNKMEDAVTINSQKTGQFPGSLIHNVNANNLTDSAFGGTIVRQKQQCYSF